MFAIILLLIDRKIHSAERIENKRVILIDANKNGES